MDDYIPERDDDAVRIEAEMAAWYEALEKKPYFVRCKICSAPDLAPERILRQRGWALSGQGEFCPSH